MSKTKRGKSGGSTAAGGGLPRWEQGLLSTHFEEVCAFQAYTQSDCTE